jgi:hypothetical protein
MRCVNLRAIAAVRNGGRTPPPPPWITPAREPSSKIRRPRGQVVVLDAFLFMQMVAGLDRTCGFAQITRAFAIARS